LNKPVIISQEVLVSEEVLAEPVILPDVTPVSPATVAAGPAYIVLAGISFSHFLNDTMQSLIASIYPILKDSYSLDFAQIGMITLAFQFTASLLQPLVGHFTDKKAQPFSLAIGMGSTFFGLLLLSVAGQYSVILIAAALVGLGSAVFHPESARIARLASGGRYGFAQSVFQLGGSFGTSMGPVLAALIVVPFGQPSIAWFSSIAFLAIVILWRIGKWYKPQIAARKFHAGRAASGCAELAPRDGRARRAGGAAVLQAALCLEPVELLHLLSDRQIPRLDPDRPALSVRLPCRQRGRRVLRRTAGRSLRA
jgi:FSR family fosmidomycin resistance protein-like MFS transporter